MVLKDPDPNFKLPTVEEMYPDLAKKRYNIIFLDIDGVLNSEIFYRNRNQADLGTHPLCEFDPFALDLVDQLCQDTGSKIVISSTWRLGREIEEMRNIFKQFNFETEIIDYTPFHMQSWSVRGNEIASWLEQNTMKLFNIQSYNFNHYAIIDDDNDMLLTQKDNFFQTDPYSGMSPKIYEDVNKYLSNLVWNI